MAKQLRTTTNYEWNRLEELQRVIAKGVTPRQTFRQRAAILGVGAACAAAGLLLLWLKLRVPAVFALILGIGFLAIGLWFYPFRAWTASRVMHRGGRRIINEFVLEKHHILVYLDQDSARYPYTDCRQLLEAEHCLYVMLKDGKGLMLDKANVRGGSADDLRGWLEEKCGTRAEWTGRRPRG